MQESSDEARENQIKREKEAKKEMNRNKVNFEELMDPEQVILLFFFNFDFFLSLSSILIFRLKKGDYF